MGKFWDEFKKNAGDQMRGSLKHGASTSYSHNRAAMKAARQEREERELQQRRMAAAAKLERQADVWVQKFGPDRSRELKHKPGDGYMDLYFGGVGKPDGVGHGHIRVWDDGREQIVREPSVDDSRGARKDATLLDDVTRDKRV